MYTRQVIKMKQSSLNLASFCWSKIELPQNMQLCTICRLGFMYNRYASVIQCSECSFVIPDLKRQLDFIVAEHRNWNPNCSFVNLSSTENTDSVSALNALNNHNYSQYDSQTDRHTNKKSDDPNGLHSATTAVSPDRPATSDDAAAVKDEPTSGLVDRNTINKEWLNKIVDSLNKRRDRLITVGEIDQVIGTEREYIINGKLVDLGYVDYAEQNTAPVLMDLVYDEKEEVQKLLMSPAFQTLLRLGLNKSLARKIIAENTTQYTAQVLEALVFLQDEGQECHQFDFMF